MPPERPATLCFNDFALDLERGCLRCGTAEVRLRPKSFEVLRYLVEHPRRLISKEELIHAAWPNSFVTDNSLVQCLIEIRRALEDEAQTIVRTVPRRGYIFDVPVSTLTDVRRSAASANEPGPPTEPAHVTDCLAPELQHSGAAAETPDLRSAPRLGARSARIAFFMVVPIVVACAVLGVEAFKGRLGERFLSSRGDIHSIAVLPLEGLSNEADLDYFTDGVTDALITDLAQIDALRVVSRTTALQYRKPRKPLPQIARELNVDAVVEGTAARSGNRVRISAQLVLAREDRHVWAKSYEGDLHNILGLQDEVARDIAHEIRVKVTPQEETRLASAPVVNPEAYDSYLKSRQFILGAQRTADDARKGLEYARRASAQQPDSALLLANVADALITMNLLDTRNVHGVMAEAKAVAERAIRMDDSIGGAHYALAMVHFNYDWDFPGAEHEFGRALELDPHSAETHSFYGFYLSAMGRHDEAVGEMRRGLELDPLSILQNRNVGAALYYAHRYDEAAAQFEHTAALEPNYPVVYNWLSWLFEARRMDGPAIQWALKGMAANGVAPARISELRAAAAQDSRAFWKRSLGQPSTGDLNKMPGVVAYQLAATAVHLGDPQLAMQYLQRAVDDRAYWVPFVKVDPRFDDLRSDSRFQDLLQGIGLR
jgi:TolB-like protein/DNA-binding winged helix-turn-helix (wHTH) protein/Tfp pilus assembly protein PilF